MSTLQASRKAKLSDAPSRVDSEAGRRADAAEQELRAASTRTSDAEDAAAAHRQAHTDVLVANAELQACSPALIYHDGARVMSGLRYHFTLRVA